jgi:WD40 repeat protein
MTERREKEIAGNDAESSADASSRTVKKRPPPPKRPQKVRAADGRGTQVGQNVHHRRANANRSSSDVFIVIGFSVMIALTLVIVAMIVFVPPLLRRESKDSETQEVAEADEPTMNERQRLLTEPVDRERRTPTTPNPVETDESPDDDTPDGSPDADPMDGQGDDSPGDNGTAQDPPPSSQSNTVGKPVIDTGAVVTALAWSTDGNQLAVGDDTSDIRIYDVKTGNEVAGFTAHAGAVKAIAWNRSLPYLATAGEDSAIKTWKTADWSLDTTINHPGGGTFTDLVWRDGGKRIVAGDNDGIVHSYNANQPNIHKAFDYGRQAGAVEALVGSQVATNLFVAGHADGAFLKWDVTNVLPREVALQHKGTLWDEVTGKKTTIRPVPITPHLRDLCFDVALSANDQFLAVANNDVDIWDLNAGKSIVRTLLVPGRADGYRVVAWQPTGTLVAAGDPKGEVALIDARRRRVALVFNFKKPIQVLAWRQDGLRLAVGCESGVVHLPEVQYEGDSKPAPAPVAADKVLPQVERFLKDEDWWNLAKAFSLLTLYDIPDADAKQVEQLKVEMRRVLRPLLKEAEELAKSNETRAQAAVLLQRLVDLDHDGNVGKQARDWLVAGKIGRVSLRP